MSYGLPKKQQEVGGWRSLAARQHGAISRRQLLGLGLTSDAIARLLNRWLEPCLWGVYRVRGSPRTWQQQLWIAQLWAGDEATFSHRTAWWIHGLEGLRQKAIDVTTPKKTTAPVPHIFIHQTKVDRLPEPVVVAGLKVTKAARTLLDIGSVTRPWYVEFALEDALRKQVVDIGELWTILETEGGRGCPGTRILRQLLEQRPVDYEALHSVLEIHLEKLIIDSPLRPHRRQHQVMTSVGVPADVDFAWPEAELGVEGEGYRWHSGRRRWQSDMDRQNALAEVGWLLLRFSYQDVTRRPRHVIETIERTLARRTSRENLRNP